MAMASDTVPGMEGEATLIDEQQVSLATPAALTAVSQVEESVEYFTTTSRVEKCELTTKHLEKYINTLLFRDTLILCYS